MDLRPAKVGYTHDIEKAAGQKRGNKVVGLGVVSSMASFLRTGAVNQMLWRVTGGRADSQGRLTPREGETRSLTSTKSCLAGVETRKDSPVESAQSTGFFQTESDHPSNIQPLPGFIGLSLLRKALDILELARKAGLSQKLLLLRILESELGLRSVLRSGGPETPCLGIGGIVLIEFPRGAQLQCPSHKAAPMSTWARQCPKEKKEKIGNSIHITMSSCICM
ncbi:hypothetical protein BDK51DRAFT_29848 [Blyttiomyces helicus]|uniref:Uncharacterized protein n=1 Tax=Blyttiomyces helicus TaxID=388810 RepID=A0A4P9WPJ9_9FUNG|nr:hypothetical protein BDK51DRAFT_29848 [Blyttiomyces helicus]|eukprot:RKO94442.1 hypothetical protein BDK51DRAFT_29848 [Blyttiomyces helicus]